jgi:hypothetical protein
MKKIVLIFLIGAICCAKASAQKESKTFSVGFGIEAGIPTGDLSNLYSAAIGLTIRFSYHVGPGFVTLTTGAIGYDPKTIVVGQKKKVGLEIPVRAGYKYIIQHHFFVMGEIGYADFKSYYGQNGELVSTSSGSFIAAPSAGVQFNAFEVGLRYGMDFRSGGGGVFGVRIGFNF